MSHLLATEAGASGPGLGIAIVILVAALVAFAVAFFVVGPGRRRGPKVRGDIPLAMRPYHSDEELEHTGMERAMSWGVALAAFAALFVPVYWLIEPQRINAQIDDFYTQDVAFGREQYASACVQCHGETAQGGSAPHPNPDIDAPWPAPNLTTIVARYEDNDNVTDIREFMQTTIARGRPGTPMPAWSSAYGGSMNDQQISVIVTYLLSIQTGEASQAQAYRGQSGRDVFLDNCARCHGQDAEGRVGPSLRAVLDKYGADPDDPASVREAQAHIRHVVNNGIIVPTGANMPAWGDVLEPEAIDAVVEYLTSIQQNDEG